MYGLGVIVLGLLSTYMNVHVCQGLTAEEISQFSEDVQVSIFVSLILQETVETKGKNFSFATHRLYFL